MRAFIRYLLSIFALSLVLPPVAAGDDSQVDVLLARLDSPVAADQLIKLGRTDPAARRAIAMRLPPLLAKDPPPESAVPPGRWANGFRVAGELKIVEAVPALIKHIVLLTDAVSGLSLSYEFRNRAAVQALIEIGQPAVPAVVGMLKQGDSLQRQASAYILGQIASDAALQALKKDLPNESDPKVKHRIEEALRLQGDKGPPRP